MVSRRPLAFFAIIGLFLAGIHCDSATAPTPAPVSPLVLKLSTAAEHAIAGEYLESPAAVRVTRDDVPVPDVIVRFSLAEGGGSISDSIVKTDVNGIATARDWRMGTRSATNVLRATVDSALGSPILISTFGGAGPATQLRVAIQPVGGASGAALVTQPVVEAADTYGNRVTTVTGTVTVSIASGTGRLTGTTTAVLGATGVLGSATFTNVHVVGVGPKTLAFSLSSASSLPGVESSSLNIGPAPLTGIAFVTGGSQSVAAGTPVPVVPTVRVTDSTQTPVGGVSVTFSINGGGGTISGATATTDPAGQASVGAWTLGTTAGTNTLRAAATGITATATLNATAVAGPPGAMLINGGDGQNYMVGAALLTAPSVKVVDAFGNVLGGQTVTFAVASGGGSVTGATPTTNTSGIAAVGSWRLGTTAGTNTLTATAGSFTTTFTARGLAPAAMVITQQPDRLTAGYGAKTPAIVQVRDSTGLVIPGALIPITATVASGSGALVGANTFVTIDGVVTFSSLVFDTPGTKTLTFSAAGLTPVTTNAFDVIAAVPSSMVLNSAATQTAGAGTLVGTLPSVKVTDLYGNLLNNIGVTFTLGAASGSITGGNAVSNSAGIATLGSWTVGGTLGAQMVTATVNGSTLPPITFTTSVSPGAPTKLVFSVMPVATVSGGLMSPQPIVELRDAFDNVATNYNGFMGVSVESGTATLTGNKSLGVVIGVATFVDLKLTGPGVATLRFQPTGATVGKSTGPIQIIATAPSSIALAAGDGQFATAGSVVSTPPAVLLTDATGAPIAGWAAQFMVTGGDGSIAATALSDANGIASAPWTLGTVAGLNRLTVTSPQVTGAVLFAATGVPGPPVKLALRTQPSGAIDGVPLVTQPVVALTDVNGNVSSTPSPAVTASIASGGGTLAGTTSVIPANGVATFTDLRVTGAPTATVAFAAPGMTSVTSATINIVSVAGPPAVMTIVGGNNQTATVGAALAIAPSVRVYDANGNLVPNASVTFTAASGNGTLIGNSATTNGAGIATIGSWTLGTIAGPMTMTATVAGTPAVTFGATALAGAAAAVSVATGDNQESLLGAPVPVAPSVAVSDQYGNRVSGARVDFVVASGFGAVTGGSKITGVSGIAAVDSWKLGAAAGLNTLTATLAGTGATATFTAVSSPVVFRITLRFLTAMSPSQQAAFTNAAQRWQSLITAHTGPTTVNRPAGSCFSGAPAINEVITDVVIYASIAPIDGPGTILGFANACGVNSATLLPAYGVMQFDSADIITMESAGTFTDVVTHEMGHVLGIGTQWTAKGLLANAGSTDPYFTGLNARTQFTAVGGASYVGNRVPVENTGGSGTAGSHWRETVFGRELMTGFIAGPGNPLSLVTVGSLLDLGYSVNYDAADSYILSANGPGGTGPILHLVNDILPITPVLLPPANRPPR